MVAAQGYMPSRDDQGVPMQCATHLSGMPAGWSVTAGHAGRSGWSFLRCGVESTHGSMILGTAVRVAPVAFGVAVCTGVEQSSVPNELQLGSPGLRRRC